MNWKKCNKIKEGCFECYHSVEHADTTECCFTCPEVIEAVCDYVIDGNPLIYGFYAGKRG